MKALKRFMERIRPSFEAGGRLHAFRSVYEGMDTFLFTPRQTAAAWGAQIHDALDSKRIMIMVIVALLPCFFSGCTIPAISIGWPPEQRHFRFGSSCFMAFWPYCRV